MAELDLGWALDDISSVCSRSDDDTASGDRGPAYVESWRCVGIVGILEDFHVSDLAVVEHLEDEENVNGLPVSHVDDGLNRSAGG